MRISSVDSSEDQIVSSSDFESGSSPLTDTTNEDDVDWDYLSEEDENDDVDGIIIMIIIKVKKIYYLLIVTRMTKTMI